LIRARDWRERGFALVRLPDGTLLRDAAALSTGQSVAIQMKGATLDATINAINPDPTEGDA
jgi:exonuclease VII large subunit